MCKKRRFLPVFRHREKTCSVARKRLIQIKLAEFYPSKTRAQKCKKACFFRGYHRYLQWNVHVRGNQKTAHARFRVPTAIRQRAGASEPAGERAGRKRGGWAWRGVHGRHRGLGDSGASGGWTGGEGRRGSGRAAARGNDNGKTKDLSTAALRASAQDDVSVVGREWVEVRHVGFVSKEGGLRGVPGRGRSRQGRNRWVKFRHGGKPGGRPEEGFLPRRGGSQCRSNRGAKWDVRLRLHL
jgi:hypothetical protein